jgi:hypothetical protein
MNNSLVDALEKAIDIRLHKPDIYAQLVLAVLEKQEGLNWLQNLGGMLSLVEQARPRRSLARPS